MFSLSIRTGVKSFAIVACMATGLIFGAANSYAVPISAPTTTFNIDFHGTIFVSFGDPDFPEGQPISGNATFVFGPDGSTFGLASYSVNGITAASLPSDLRNGSGPGDSYINFQAGDPNVNFQDLFLSFGTNKEVPLFADPSDMPTSFAALIAVFGDFNGRLDYNASDGHPYSVYFTLAATPIPATLPLFISALGGLGFVGWRRQRMAA